MNEPKPIIVGNYKPSGHGCGKIHYGGGHIQPREQDFVISEEGISMSLPASYNLHCFKIMEIVRYEDIQDISVPKRGE